MKFLSFLLLLVGPAVSLIQHPSSASSSRLSQVLLPRPRNDDSSAYTFTHEGFTPQKLVTGCQGVTKSTGQIEIDYYVIDATGTKKFIYPGTSAQVAFPGPGLFPGFNRMTTVYFHEMCFPKQCGAPNCGYIVGPVTNSGKTNQNFTPLLYFLRTKCKMQKNEF